MVENQYQGEPDDIALLELTDYINRLRDVRDLSSDRKTATRLGLSRNMAGEIIKGVRDPRRYEAQKLFTLCTTHQEREQLAKLLIQVHLGANTDSLLQGSYIKPLINNPLVAMFTDAVRPKVRNWSNKEATSIIFAQHMGALVSILQCMSLFAANPSLQPPTYNDIKVFESLENTIKTTGYVDWSYAPDFCVWSLGFFLNKGENNIARGIQLCVYHWLKSKLEESLSEYSPLDPTHDTINFQIKELCGKIPDQDIVNDLENLNRFIDNDNIALLKITNPPLSLSQEFNSGLSSIEDLTKIYHELFSEQDDLVMCTVVSLSRTLTSISQQHGTYRRELTYVVEWVALAKSLMWLSKLWNAMLADLGLLEPVTSEIG